MTPEVYALLGLTAIIGMLAAALTFAVLRFVAAARDSGRQLRGGASETALLSSALEEAVAKLKQQERETAARAEASERLSGEIIASLTAGALAGSSALIGQLGPARKLFGGVLEPASAYALARGMKTLDVRIARQNASAMAVAEWLSRHPKVTSVLYPGLASHPDHAIAARQMRGFGGMVTFDVGSYAAACRTFDRLQIIKRAASLGGVESLCSLPVLTSQYGFTDAQLQAAGVTRGMLRLSIGLEHTDDLIGDLEHSLN